MKTKARPKKNVKKSAKATLMIRLDRVSKSQLHRAAKLRHMTLSDYVRQVTLAQAQREIEASESNVIRMSREGQIAFWKALHAPVKLTPAQKRLGAMMRGEA